MAPTKHQRSYSPFHSTLSSHSHITSTAFPPVLFSFWEEITSIIPDLKATVRSRETVTSSKRSYILHLVIDRNIAYNLSRSSKGEKITEEDPATLASHPAFPILTPENGPIRVLLQSLPPQPSRHPPSPHIENSSYIRKLFPSRTRFDPCA